MGNAKAKIVIIGAVVVVMLMALISGQNPFDMMFNLIKDAFVFLFFILLFVAPLAFIGYLIIICFTDFGGGMNMSFSEVTKQKVSGFLQSLSAPPPQPSNNNKMQASSKKSKKKRPQTKK